MIELRYFESKEFLAGDPRFNRVLQYRSHTESWEEVLTEGARGYKPKKVTTEWKDVPTVRED